MSAGLARLLRKRAQQTRPARPSPPRFFFRLVPRQAACALLTRLYPRRWRERYGDEFEAMLETGRGRAMMTAMNVAWWALCERSRQWEWRAPWAMFGLAPILFLMAAYFVACLILWTGWRMFLPESVTPFVPIEGLAIYYFGVGRLLYYGAPILAGWAVGLTAVFQNSKSFWPAAGLAAIALLGATAQVQVTRASDLSAAGQVSLHFAMASLWRGSSGASYGATILALTLLPWLVWRFYKSYSRPA